MSQWFNQFYAAIAQSPLSHWLETLPGQLKHWQKADEELGRRIAEGLGVQIK